MKIFISGGAGYIGSHVVKALGSLGHEIVVYDNLSTGFSKAITHGELVEGDLSDSKKLDQLFLKEKFDAVFHFAGNIVVSESIGNPLKYYHNNTVNSLNLLTVVHKYNVNKFIFSSSCAVYGVPEDGLCSENSPTNPINPYGRSKLMTELMLKDLSYISNLRYVSLRYFNVAGADLDGQIGQSLQESTHLIKNACEVAVGKYPSIKIFGTDYPTPDGTCIRDYVHVTDLADAHVKAFDYLVKGGKSEVLNCGYGHGFSVNEVLAKFQEVTGVKIKIEHAQRRPGDPPCLVAKLGRINSLIGWAPKYDNLDLIIKSAYEWEKKRPY